MGCLISGLFFTPLCPLDSFAAYFNSKASSILRHQTVSTSSSSPPVESIGRISKSALGRVIEAVALPPSPERVIQISIPEAYSGPSVAIPKIFNAKLPTLFSGSATVE